MRNPIGRLDREPNYQRVVAVPTAMLEKVRATFDLAFSEGLTHKKLVNDLENR